MRKERKEKRERRRRDKEKERERKRKRKREREKPFHFLSSHYDIKSLELPFEPIHQKKLIIK